MANRFVRSIRDIINIDKQPLHTNEQNDLLSNKKGDVFVRTFNKYERITGLSDIEQDLKDLKSEIDGLNPDTDKQSQQIEDIKSKQKSIINRIEYLEDNNDKDKISELQDDIDRMNKKIQRLDYDKQIHELKKQIDNLDLEHIDERARDDINALQQKVDDIDLSDAEDKQAREQLEDIQKEIENIKDELDDIDLSDYVKKEDINQEITSTDWEDIKIKNDYKDAKSTDFKPSYKIIDYGEFKQIYIRFGFENLTEDKNVIGEIPSEIVNYNIYGVGISTIAKIPPKIVITTGGNIEIYPNENDSYKDTDYVIFEGSWII